MANDITVLHVDDSEPLLDITAELLETVDDGITVIGEPEPTNVLNRIRPDGVDCVVSDYAMPGMDGIELCKRVREEHPDLPFFVFTSRSGADLIDQAFAAGATDFIQKDPGVAQFTLLANRIRNAVAHHDVQRRLGEASDAN